MILGARDVRGVIRTNHARGDGADRGHGRQDEPPAHSVRRRRRLLPGGHKHVRTRRMTARVSLFSASVAVCCCDHVPDRRYPCWSASPRRRKWSLGCSKRWVVRCAGVHADSRLGGRCTGRVPCSVHRSSADHEPGDCPAHRRHPRSDRSPDARRPRCCWLAGRVRRSQHGPLRRVSPGLRGHDGGRAPPGCVRQHQPDTQRCC